MAAEVTGGERRPDAVQWEYRTALVVSTVTDPQVDRLDPQQGRQKVQPQHRDAAAVVVALEHAFSRLGRDGWELVAVFADVYLGPAQRVAVFKRAGG